MTNNNKGMTTDIKTTGNTFDEVQSFKYLSAFICEEGSKSEVLTRIAQAPTALSSLKLVWRDSNSTLRSKISRDIDLPVCMRNLDTHRPHSAQNTSNGDEMLPKTPQHSVYKAHHK